MWITTAIFNIRCPRVANLRIAVRYEQGTNSKEQPLNKSYTQVLPKQKGAELTDPTPFPCMKYFLSTVQFQFSLEMLCVLLKLAVGLRSILNCLVSMDNGTVVSSTKMEAYRFQ